MKKTAVTLEALAPAKGILLITNNQQLPSKGSGYELASVVEADSDGYVSIVEGS